jgi:hypothetical protein
MELIIMMVVVQNSLAMDWIYNGFCMLPTITVTATVTASMATATTSPK